MNVAHSGAVTISGRPVWWLRPYLLLALVILPIYILLALLPIAPRYGKYYLSGDYVALGAAFLAIMTVTAYVASKWSVERPQQPDFSLPPVFMDTVALLTVAAYVLWFWRLAADPSLLSSVLAGSAMHVRGEITTVPGLTTLSQFGFVYATLWSLSRWIWKGHLSKRFTLYLWVIILLTLIRTIAWGERLATIEVLLPLATVRVLCWRPSTRISKSFLALAPFLLFVILFLFFGATELFRSWGRQHAGADSASSYMWDRFTYYYFSSMNNGCGLLQEFSWPQWDMQFTLKWIYTIPGLGPWLRESIHPVDAAAQFLKYYADSEFTTYTGIFAVIYDGGILFGLAVAGGLGTAIGLSYRSSLMGRNWGLMLYPLLYLHLLEILRLFYLGESRTMPIWLGFLLALWIGGMPRRRKSRSH